MMTPSWYPPIAVVLNAYLAVISFVFLAWFTWPGSGPKERRNGVAAGLWWAALGIIWYAAGTLQRFLPGGLHPRFRSDLDAARALLTAVLFAVAITHWLVAKVVNRRRLRRQALA